MIGRRGFAALFLAGLAAGGRARSAAPAASSFQLTNLMLVDGTGAPSRRAWVHGVVVYESGRTTAARPGRVLRRVVAR